MKNVTLWFWLMLLIIIHTIDMELTSHYIGNDWARETFLFMSVSIKYVGINNALWISRLIVYLFMFFCTVKKDNKNVINFLILATILYWVSMIDWLFTLHICKWPLGI